MAAGKASEPEEDSPRMSAQESDALARVDRLEPRASFSCFPQCEVCEVNTNPVCVSFAALCSDTSGFMKMAPA